MQYCVLGLKSLLSWPQNMLWRAFLLLMQMSATVLAYFCSGASQEFSLRSHSPCLHICLTEHLLCFLQALVLLANCGKNWTHTSYANESIDIFCYILIFILKYLLLNCFALNVYNSLVFFACPETDIFVGKHFVFVNLYISYIQFDYPLSWPKHSYVIIRSGDNS